MLNVNDSCLCTYDRCLVWASLALLALGLLMVASTTVNLADSRHGDALFFFWRQAAYIGTGLVLGALSFTLDTRHWQALSVPLLLFGGLLLLLVLAVGHEVNGSLRWIHLGWLRLQPSEAMKLFMVVYMAGYLVRRSTAVRQSLRGFINPMLVLIAASALLLLEPDYGTAVVLFVTVLGMLFLAGVPMRQFLLWVVLVSITLFLVILIAPYRLQRLTTFMNPWADPFNSGFQLTQALIAIGRGDWWGVGLGASVQKLAYLPEAHTDFLFAILVEELGLAGGLSVIGLFAVLVWRAFVIARQALLAQRFYAAWLAYGLGLCLGLQAAINLGVNLGLLPTKGLTLPLMSYGGSSLLVSCVMIALVLRVDYETRSLSPSSQSRTPE